MSSKHSARTVALQLEQAISWHERGNLPNAMDMYQRILSIEPENYEALHRAGTLFWQVGRMTEALDFFRRACIAQPNNFDACYNQSVVLHALKRYDEALLILDRALLIKPNSAEVYFDRGVIFGTIHQYENSLLSYQKVISFRKNHPEAYNNSGLILLEVFKNIAESLACFEMAIKLKNDFAEAYFNRGLALRELDRHEEALVSYDKAIELNPDYCDAYNNRGLLLKGFQRYDEALESFDKAIKLRPDYANSINNRGAVLEKLGRYDEALASFDRLIELFPGFADLHYNRGLLLTRMGQYEASLQSYEQAVSINANHADANYNRALIRLRLGNFEAGWPLFEWRWKTDQHKRYLRNFKQPLWLGENTIGGKTLLVHAEQGLGDYIQFVRYIPLIEALGANVVLEVPVALVSLISTLEGSFSIIKKGEALPEFDLHCPIMSLPLALGTSVSTIPAPVSYLASDVSKQIEFRKRLGSKARPRIGLVWSGNVNHLNDANRSLSLQILAPMLTLDLDFHCLQKEIRPDDMEMMSGTSIISHQDELHDFSDTAALIAELDLVITVDTSVAHLAAALGKKVWILLPYVADFRWLLERNDSPWYPTATLFRQERAGDWGSVISRVILELELQLLNHRNDIGHI